MHLAVRSSSSHSKSVLQIGEMLRNISDSGVVSLSCYHKNDTQATSHHGLCVNRYRVGQTSGVFLPATAFEGLLDRFPALNSRANSAQPLTMGMVVPVALAMSLPSWLVTVISEMQTRLPVFTTRHSAMSSSFASAPATKWMLN